MALSEDCDSHLSTPSQFNDHTFDVVEKIFISHLTKLPRIIYTGDEEEQSAGFNLLNGLIKTLSQTDHIKILLVHEHVLNKLLSALLASVELDRPNELLEEQHSIRIIDETADDCTKLRTATPWKSFKNLRNQTLMLKLRNTCQLLSRDKSAKELVLTSLLKSFCSNSRNCNEILVLFQNFVLSETEKGEWSTLDAAILEELLAYTHWGLGLQVTSTTELQMEELGESQWYEDRTEGLYESAISIRMSDVKWKSGSDRIKTDDILTVNDVKFNVLHTCLVLETVATYASSLGTDFQPYLLNSLHRLLEKSGSSHYMIHAAGIYALSTLKTALSLNSITELIFNNADYIAFFVNKSLRRADESKSALDVLSVVIKYSSLDSIPHLENIITTVLTESAKPYQLGNILSFLKVFHMILQGIQIWLAKSDEVKLTETKEIKQSERAALGPIWVDLIRQEDNLEDEDVDDNIPLDEELNNIEQEAENEDNNEIEPEKPVFIEFTINILKRCVRYVSSKKRDEKLVALDAICVGLEIIKSHENELLPMVHSIWQPFVERVKDNDPIVLRKCFSVLHVLAVHAKDFIYHRTAK